MVENTHRLAKTAIMQAPNAAECQLVTGYCRIEALSIEIWSMRLLE